MKNLFYPLFLFTFSVSLLSGCATFEIAHFSMLTTKNVDLSQPSEKVGSKVIGKDKRIWFIIPFRLPRIDNAVNDALKNGNGDFMTDIDVEHRVFSIPLIYYRVWYEVKGDLWRIKPVSGNAP